MRIHPRPRPQHRTEASARRRRAAAAALCLALLAPMLVSGPAGASDASAGDSGHSAAPTDADRNDPPARRLRAVMRCGGGDGAAPEITCRWRARTAGAAGFVVVRADAEGRSVVYRSDDLTQRTFTDTAVEFDTRYRYRLILVDADGDRVGRSRVATAIVRSEQPELLGLTCDGTDTDPIAVTCTWDTPESTDAESVQLWRITRGSPRVLVTTVTTDQTTADDELPAGVERARYAVIARDADGVIVARSRAVRLV